MADLLSKTYTKTIVARPVAVLNRSHSAEGPPLSLHYEATYEIGLKSEEPSRFYLLTKLHLRYVQNEEGGHRSVDMPLPYNPRDPFNIAPSKTVVFEVDSQGKFIGELLPREAMQTLIDITSDNRSARLAKLDISNGNAAGRG